MAELAFGRVAHIERDVNWGWFIRRLHQIGARGLIAGMFVHIMRGFYYDSYDRTPGV